MSKIEKRITGIGQTFSGNMILPPFNKEEITGKSSVLERFIPSESIQLNGKVVHNSPVFSFLVHPRDPFDALACAEVAGINLSPLAGLFPGRLEQILKNHFLYNSLAKLPPFFIKHSNITIDGYDVQGNLTAVLLYGEQMLSNGWRSFAQERIVDAIQMVRDQGIKLIGLGAHTSPATLGGKLLRQEDGQFAEIKGIGITNGNAFTASVTAEAVDRFKDILEQDPQDILVGLVGATGSVGSATTYLLAEKGYRLILNGRSENKLRTQFRSLIEDVTLSVELEDLRKCDVVAVMTSGARSSIKPEYISPGTFIYEDTQPRNITESIAGVMKKEGNLLVDGGFVYIPGYSCGFNLRLPSRVAFACLAETLILALEGRMEDYSVGDAEVNKAKEMSNLARKYGITLAFPTWNSKPILNNEIEWVKYLNLKREDTTYFTPRLSTI